MCESAVRVNGVAQGAGLGLAVAREILAARGGRLALLSEPGVGTSVRASFPAGAGVTPAPGAQPLALLRGGVRAAPRRVPGPKAQAEPVPAP